MISLKKIYEQVLDIKQIHDVVEWHENNRDHKPGESVGIFAVLPRELAEQYPIEGRQDNDNSPSHVTILYIGNISPSMEDNVVKIIEQVCMNFKPFMVSIRKPKKFINHKDEIILHSPVKSRKLEMFHDMLKQEFLNNQIQVDNKFPDFKPHITICYAKDKEELKKYKDIQPQGEFMINSVYLWGSQEPKFIFLGKK